MKAEELRKSFTELLEEMHRENIGKVGAENVVFPQKAKELIKEIAELSRQTQIYQSVQDQREAFWNDTKEATPGLIYGYMLDRVVNAPTRIHANYSIILIMPRLDELLNGSAEEVQR